MQTVYAFNEVEKRKLKFLYSQSGIRSRYSVIPDYSHSIQDWKFYPRSESLEPFPGLEKRMEWYYRYAAPVAVDSIRNCIEGKIRSSEITHLISVSCTGMSAPGLDLQVMDLMDLPKTTYRTSINFMGCYAAIHALKIAHDICNSSPSAKVMIVCTELCTLHFQREATADNIASSLLFGDGSAALLITGDDNECRGMHIKKFYSEVIPKGKKDMAWELSSNGFLMTLSGYVPGLIEEDFSALVQKAIEGTGLSIETVDHWCIHPGGKRILEAVQRTLQLEDGVLRHSYEIMKDYGNMSSPTIVFVLKEILKELEDGRQQEQNSSVFGAAFGPGLTMETFVASY
jgi:predicted naringenin-chalcone synthase